MVVVRFDRPVRRRWFLAVAFFSSLLLVRGMVELTGPALPATGAVLEPLRQVATAEKAVVLTVNIQWGRSVPQRVLDELAELEVQATFFVSGPWAQANAGLIQSMRQRGHDIGTLGHEAIHLSAAEPQVIRRELQASLRAITAAGAPVPRYFRPPGGVYDHQLLATAQALGLETVLWSVDGRDWLAASADVVVERILAEAKPGSIILLHASDHNELAPLVLPPLVTGLHDRGYRFLPLSAALAEVSRRP
ncbi:MAG TPA: polysaccharide deacetylase family protein [Bacillota bacterium]